MSVFPFFFSSRRRHTMWPRDWSSDVCSSDLAFGEGDTVGDLPQDHRHRNAQRGADGGEQLRGSFLLSALHLGKVPERYACGGGDLTQRTSLPLARATKDVTNLSS